MNLHKVVNKALFLAFLFTLITPAFAQTSYSVYIDSDFKASTGCTVNTVAEGTFPGMDTRLEATVDGATLQVTGVTRSTCNGVSFDSGANVGGPYAVGLNNGVAGSDVIELSDDIDSLAAPGTQRVQFVFVASEGQADDVLSNAGDGFVLNLLSIPIPALGTLGILLLILTLALVGLTLLRSNPHLRKTLAGVLLVGCGVTWAANFVSDGLVNDWVGVPAIGSDASGDASNGSNAIDILVRICSAASRTRLFPH